MECIGLSIERGWVFLEIFLGKYSVVSTESSRTLKNSDFQLTKGN